MCGIFGFWKFEKISKEDLIAARKCVDGLEHRGPDDSGVWCDKKNKIFFGHRRLSIIDVKRRSRQPFVFRNLVLNFNGEIYNYKELRETLKSKGHIFKTNSDTEVLLHSWYEWKENCVDYFDGMYAFAIFDGKRLFLVTDPFCEKPLYVYFEKSAVYFASEPMPLIKYLKINKKLSKMEASYFLSFGFLPSPSTGFANLQKMESATIFSFDKPNSFKKKKYWKFPGQYIEKGKIAPYTKDEIFDFKEELIRSISLRLRADVNSGLFLSSGLDSALIAAIVSKELEYNLKTFTVSFSDGQNESEYARLIANHLGLSNFQVDSRADSSWQNTPESLENIYNIPNDNITCLAFRQLSEFAKKHITVALCGMGGDELVFGYNKYHFLYKWRVLYNDWLRMTVLLKFFKPKIFKKFFIGNNLTRFINLKNGGVMQEDILEELDFSKSLEKSFDDECLHIKAHKFDLNFTLQENYIPSVERASMSQSLEVRSPFLSKNLFKIISRIDQRKFFKFGQKSLFKLILKDYLPDDLINKRKLGFVYPLGRYLKSVNNKILKNNSFFSKKIVDYFWKNRLKENFNRIILRIMILEHFYSENRDN